MAVMRLAGKQMVGGSAAGTALVTDTPLSFWGGVNPRTGEVIDRRHPLAGECLADRVLVLPCGRGSCSASGVLLESIANGTAPVGIIVSELDPILGLGAILGDELLGRTVPVVLISQEDRVKIASGAMIRLGADGSVEVGD